MLQGYTDLELLSNQCEQIIHHALTIDISVESLLKLQVCNAALLTAAEPMYFLLHVTTHIRFYCATWIAMYDCRSLVGMTYQSTGGKDMTLG